MMQSNKGINLGFQLIEKLLLPIQKEFENIEKEKIKKTLGKNFEDYEKYKSILLKQKEESKEQLEDLIERLSFFVYL